MFSHKSSTLFRSASDSACPALGQVRYKRTIAYPRYKTKELGFRNPKSHSTILRLQMQSFLGPRNFKGDYHFNKYYYAPQDHKPNFIKPDLERGNSLTLTKEDEAPRQVRITHGRELQPFPDNPFTKTNLLISNELKARIVKDIVHNQLPSQEVAIKYGLKIARIEAIVKLSEIESRWHQQNKITKDMKKMSETMYKMFPLFNPQTHAENLTEIPIPPKTQKSRFITIAESEPFGPLDASKLLGLEPAQEKLEKLSENGEHALHAHAEKAVKESSFYAPVLEGEKSVFKFMEAKVGEVGFRYGTPLRDNKGDRKIGYDASGKMIYLI